MADYVEYVGYPEYSETFAVCQYWQMRTHLRRWRNLWLRRQLAIPVIENWMENLPDGAAQAPQSQDFEQALGYEEACIACAIDNCSCGPSSTIPFTCQHCADAKAAGNMTPCLSFYHGPEGARSGEGDGDGDGSDSMELGEEAGEDQGGGESEDFEESRGKGLGRGSGRGPG